jgi:hypothetical protein
MGKAQIVNKADTKDIQEKVRILEKGCVLTLRTLNTAQISYWGGNDTKGFARTFKQLGPDGEGVLGAEMVSGQKDGYRFRLVPEKAVGKTAIKHYKIIALPVKRLSRHQRSYYTDETGVIRFTEKKREPTSTDPPLESPHER